MSELWRVELLGWLRAERGNQSIRRFRTKRAGILIAYLALHQSRSHPRETLAEIVWPDGDTQKAKNRLKQEISSLRRQLEPPGQTKGSVLIAEAGYVQLNPTTVVTDVAEFEQSLKKAFRAEDLHEKVRWLLRAHECSVMAVSCSPALKKIGLF